MKTKAKFSTQVVSERSSGRSGVLLLWLTFALVIGLCPPLSVAQEAVVLVGSDREIRRLLHKANALSTNVCFDRQPAKSTPTPPSPIVCSMDGKVGSSI